MTNQITIRPSSEIGLANTLSAMEQNVYAAANRNLDSVLSSSPQPANLTALERAAIIEVEALKLVGGMDLMALLLRGKIITKIRNQNLLNVHPEHPTLEEMAVSVGVSVTELSYVDALCNVVFPYLEHNGISVAETWESIQKSKFFELTPALTAIITGEMPGRGSTRESVISVLEGHGVPISPDGEPGEISDEARASAVDQLLQMGELPVREMRRQLRPSHTEDIEGIILRDDSMYYAVLRMNDDQRVMFERLTGRHTNVTVVNPDETTRPYLGNLRRMLGS